MGQKSRKTPARHPLLVYQQISQRIRTLPLLLAFLALILLSISLIGKSITLEGADTSMLDMLAAGQPLIVVIIVASALLYILAVIMGGSYIEARSNRLHVRTGLLAINISYRRIRQIRLSQVSVQFEGRKISGSDGQVARELSGQPCSIIDLTSWPWPGLGGLKRLWGRLMFSGDGDNLMIVVRDAMVFNQQLDGRLATIQQRQKQDQSAYLDPLERATRAQKGKR